MLGSSLTTNPNPARMTIPTPRGVADAKGDVFMAKIELNVEGMTCGHCQKAVKDALEGVNGVKSATVDLESGRAVVDADTNIQVLISAVEDEGYRASLAQ